MLAIEVRYLTGRCVATAYSNRLEPEWPPHPARLFSALVATWASRDEGDPDVLERAALTWLEALPAPEIAASDASVRDVYQVFVPVNDVGVLNLPDGRTVDAARDELRSAEARVSTPGLAAAEQKKAAKALAKAQVDLDKAEKKQANAVAKELAPGKVTAAGIQGAIALQPDSRVRQPRTFPSVTPEDDRVLFVWPEAEPTETQRTALDALLARLVRVGHSSSLVSARLTEAAPTRWRPDDDGERVLRVVQPGQLAALETHHRAHREVEPRVMPGRFARYTEHVKAGGAPLQRSVFGDDWIVLRRVEGPTLPMTAGPGVARVLRRATMAWADRSGLGIASALSGHKPDRSPSEDDHVAFVPLPFVGHQHATGALLGVALVLPRALDAAARRQVLGPIAAWEEAVRVEDEERPRLELVLGATGVWQLERLDEQAAQATLRPATWCDPARTWVSATPVALDRNPGDLASRDPKRLAAAVAEAEKTIVRACERIGLPRPEAVDILPAAPLAGAAKANHYPPFPEQADKLQRVLTHVRIRFDEPVRGPVIIGAGRYLGLGLLRPAHDHE